MQFVFTYIRKPVRLKRARRGCGLPARGARSEPTPRRAGVRGGWTERSPPPAAPAAPAQRSARPGRTVPCPPPPPRFLQLQERKKKNCRGCKMEKQVCQADPRSWRVAVLGARGGSGRDLLLQLWFPPKMACVFYKGCKARACFLCAAASLRTITLTYLTFHVLLIRMHLLFTGEILKLSYLSLMERRCELRLEIRLRCFG